MKVKYIKIIQKGRQETIWYYKIEPDRVIEYNTSGSRPFILDGSTYEDLHKRWDDHVESVLRNGGTVEELNDLDDMKGLFLDLL
jgi:hypothetical protein